MKNEDTRIVPKNENKEIYDVCEECKKSSKSVRPNLIMHGFKVCNSCKLAKTIFPV